MAERNYRQNCSLALGADLLGERWTLLIVRELLIQPCRFTALNANLPGMGTNLLASRLADLERFGLVTKSDTEKKRSPYVLTAAGRAIEPVLLSLIRWGYEFTEGKSDYLHRHHWDLLAMKAFFRPGRCKKTTVVQFQSRELTAWVKVSRRGFDHGMGEHDQPDLVINSHIIDFYAELQDGFYFYNPEATQFADYFDLPDKQPLLV